MKFFLRRYNGLKIIGLVLWGISQYNCILGITPKLRDFVLSGVCALGFSSRANTLTERRSEFWDKAPRSRPCILSGFLDDCSYDINRLCIYLYVYVCIKIIFSKHLIIHPGVRCLASNGPCLRRATRKAIHGPRPQTLNPKPPPPNQKKKKKKKKLPASVRTGFGLKGFRVQDRV